MGCPEILLEHKEGDGPGRYLRIAANKKPFVIGSSRDADLILHGEGVQGCHAALRFRSPNWYLCDLSGTNFLKNEEGAIDELLIENGSLVEIAGHQLRLIPRHYEPELFNQESAEKGSLDVHQVVLMRDGRVVDTHLLPADQSFVYRDSEGERALPPPKNGQWVTTEIGRKEIKQRMISAQEVVRSEKLAVDYELRRPFVAALSVMILMIGLMALLSRTDQDKAEVVLDKKSMDIIFNAKAIKKKRLESEKVVRSTKKGNSGGQEANPANPTAASMPETATAPKVSSQAAVALTSLRKSGLSALIGKIAKRANKQGLMVAGSGVAAGTVGAGRAIFSTGKSTVGGGGSASKVGPSYKLGGVGTQGKAGGVGNFKDGTGLSGSAVGMGHLIAMVDEETVIEGGLDRDVIAEVIRKNIGQIRYCYERQLSSNPDLYGKILVKFTIASTGIVFEPRVDQSTMKSAMVEGCILRRLASWKFPEPKGGTEVRVSYPFLFKAQE